MDNRLFRIDGRRVAPQRQDDLPKLARTIIAIARNRARAGLVTVQNVSFVQIQGPDVDALVELSDWQRILPFFEDGTFNTQENPTSQAGRPRNPRVAFSESVIDQADKRFYEKILGVLTGLFVGTYPTTSI